MIKTAFLLCLTVLYFSAFTQPGTVKSSLKIGALSNNFVGTLSDGDFFGSSVTYLNDIDGDGVGDVAVGSFQDDDGGYDKGGVWILLLKPDGTIKTYKKISDIHGAFNAGLNDEDHFGAGMNAIGDLDKNGICEIAVGAGADDDGGDGKGAVYIIFLDSDGTTKKFTKISELSGGLNTTLGNRAAFGSDIALIGDLDKDGIDDIAVGGPRHTVSGISKGAIWILFLNADGTVKNKTYITEGNGGFAGNLEKDGFFGCCIEGIGDLNKDGVNDIITSAFRENDGGANYGALYILFLNSNGTVKITKKISKTQGLSSVSFVGDDFLGQSIANMNDLDGDGNVDVIVGMPGNGINSVKGKVEVLFLNSDGSVKSIQEISDISGNFYGNIKQGDQFGWSLSPLYDFNGDGIMDLIVGSKKDDDGGLDRGAIWLLYLEGVKNSRKEIDLKTEIEVFPMPFYDDIHIYLPSKKTHPIMYQIYNMVGCEVGKGHLSNIVSEITLDLSYLHSGVYFMKIEQEYSSSVFKIIKSD